MVVYISLPDGEEDREPHDGLYSLFRFIDFLDYQRRLVSKWG